MRPFLATALALLAIAPAFAAQPPKPRTIRVPNGPTILQLPGFPAAYLKFNLSPKLYKSLSVSPVEAWVVAQTSASPGIEPKIIRSDAGGHYDRFALSLAKEWGMVNYDTTEFRFRRPTLDVHLLIYKIANGIMAVNFSKNEEAAYAGFQHTDVWVGVWNGKNWATIGGTKRTRESQPYY